MTGQMQGIADVDRARFLKDGFTVVGEIFPEDEIAGLRSTAVDALTELERRGLSTADRGNEGVTRVSSCDLLSIPALRGVLLDPRLLGVIGQLLGGSPHYFGDSSLRIGGNGARAWHRDNVDRVRWRGGADWDDPYPVLRCGLYLQDQARHSGGLALRPRSNRPDRRLPTLPKLVQAGPGDLIAWDLRIVHSGEAVRPRGLPRLALNPRLQTWLPERARLPEDGQRIVMFMTFGLPGLHLDNFIEYCRSREYMREAWSNSHFEREVWETARKAGLEVLHPSPDYGTPSTATAESTSAAQPARERSTPAAGAPRRIPTPSRDQ